MQNYLALLQKIINQGESRRDRTGTGTLSLFGERLIFDLSLGFPLLTTKRVAFKSLLVELIWFLRGDTNIRFLNDNGVKIWNDWIDSEGNLGPIYGKQWRDWNGIDQIKQVVEEIKKFPESRRLVVSSWNVSDLDDMALHPCHCLFQFYVSNGSKLSCHLYQRSADIFLGVPFNIASYALLTILIAKVCDLVPDRLLISFGDVHLYSNHINQANLQLKREVRNLPKVKIADSVRDLEDLFRLTIDSVILEDYDPHPEIKAQIAI